MKVNWDPAVLLSPVPAVMVSCGTIEKPNIITIAWTGVINSNPPMTYISVRPERFSHKIIKETGEFVINLTTEPLAFATDYCGVKSGGQIDKFAEMKLTAQKSLKLSAPSINESPMSIECKVNRVLELGSHDMFIADIVSVSVDDDYIDKKGKLDLKLCGLIAYAHGEYFALGKSLGTFGYSVRKKGKK